MNDYPSVALPDGRMEFAVGDLVSEEERVAVFALDVLPLPAIDGTPVASLEGEELLEVEMVFDEITEKGIESRTIQQTVRVQATQDPANVQVNETVLSWVAVQQAARSVRESTRLAREGDLGSARACLASSRRRMGRSENLAAMKEAQRLLEQAEAEMDLHAQDNAMMAKKLHAMRRRASKASSRPDPSNDPDFKSTPRP